ncbi:MAG: SpoIID/LytB domain-containing protein [Clostridia bacterium]|nr:SpoIID/LytB domain-containing protein [Clostridia bacterium]
MKSYMHKYIALFLALTAALCGASALAAPAPGALSLPVPALPAASDGALDPMDYYAAHQDEDPVFRDMDTPQAAPEKAYTAPVLLGTDHTYVRVLLSVTGNLRDVTLNGCYSLRDAAGVVRALPAYNSVYRFTASGATVSVSCDGAPVATGARFTLREHLPFHGTSGNSFSLYNTAYGARSYTGDLILYARNDALYCVNRVYIEDYLCGVIGNEIGDLSPEESLKAQAVAARSYAIKNLSPSAEYDLLDTSASQVYKGVCASDVHSAAAVAATAKQVLYKDGVIITGLYSSSNGGEKDTSRNRWGGNPAWSGESVAMDMPDLVYSINYASQQGSSYYEQVLLPSNGAKTAATDVLITRSLLPLLVSGGYCSPAATAADVTLSALIVGYVPQSKLDAVTYIESLVVRYQGYSSGRAFDLTDTIPYASLYVSQGWGLFSNGSLNQYWVGVNNGSYVLRHARRGHGIGLSQIGARQRALNGEGYASILSFYYDGAQPLRNAAIGEKTLRARGFDLPKGDVDENGLVNVADIVLLCRGLAGDHTLSAAQAANADVDDNGSVGIADAVRICRFIAGML